MVKSASTVPLVLRWCFWISARFTVCSTKHLHAAPVELELPLGFRIPRVRLGRRRVVEIIVPRNHKFPRVTIIWKGDYCTSLRQAGHANDLNVPYVFNVETARKNS